MKEPCINEPIIKSYMCESIHVSTIVSKYVSMIVSKYVSTSVFIDISTSVFIH